MELNKINIDLNDFFLKIFFQTSFFQPLKKKRQINLLQCMIFVNTLFEELKICTTLYSISNNDPSLPPKNNLPLFELLMVMILTPSVGTTKIGSGRRYISS